MFAAESFGEPNYGSNSVSVRDDRETAVVPAQQELSLGPRMKF